MTVSHIAPMIRSRPVALFLNPYVQIAIGSLLTCAAELLLKKGAVSAEPVAWLPAWIGASAMTSGWTWLGILAYIGSFVSWLYVLRIMPLNIAYSLVNVAQVLVPLDLYVCHTSRLLNPILKKVLPWIEPTRGDKTLAKFPNADALWADADS